MRIVKLPLVLLLLLPLTLTFGSIESGNRSFDIINIIKPGAGMPGGPADAGTDQDICGSLLATLEGNDPAPGTGSWSVNNGPGNVVFDNPNQFDTQFNVDQYGTYTLTWTVDDGTVTSDDVIVNFYEQPVANAGSGGDECDLDFVLAANPSVGTGTWSMTSGTGTANFLPDATDPNATVEVTEYGTKEFTWTETNGSCIDAATVQVNFYEQPVANAGSGGDECDLDFVLAANPSVGTGTWSMTSGTGTANFLPDATDPNATVEVSEYGTKEFTWTETNGSCTDAATVQVNFYEQPVANAGSGGDECDLDFVLAANPSVGTGTWSMTSGTGTASFLPDATDPNATVEVTEYGTKEFTWTETNGSCTDAATVQVNYYEQPVANAGSGGDECDLDFVLAANPSVGTGTWSMTSGTGTATFLPDATDPNATVEVTEYGTKEFTWTETNGSCTDAATVPVNFYEQPVANAGSGGDECDLDFVLAANPSVGTGTWSMTSGTGTATFLPDATDPNATVEVSEYGTKEFTWTETNGSCTDAATVLVNFYEQPVANAGSGGDECDLDFVLNATASVGTGTWSMTSGAGTATFLPDATDPNATVEVSEYGTKEFTWTETNGSCTDAATVPVNFYEQPVANAGSGGDECDLDFVLAANPSVGTGTWSMTSGTGTATFLPDATDPNATVEVTEYGTKEFTWTETNGSCTDAATVTVGFYPLPGADISGSTEVCQGESSPEITFTGNTGIAPYTFTYTVNGGSPQSVTTVSGNSVNIPVSTGTPGTFVYELQSVKDSSPADCEQVQNGTATVNVNPLPQATISGTTSICHLSGSTDIVFTGSNGTAPYTFYYTINSGPVRTITTDSGNSVNVPVSADNVGTFTYTLLSVSDASSTACERSVSGSTTVSVLPLPEADISGSTSVCQDSPSPEITFTGSDGTQPYTFTYTVNGGPQQTISTSTGNSVNLAVPTENPGQYVYDLISVEDGSSENCENPQEGEVTITINPLPGATISGDTEVCQFSSSPAITFTGINGTGPYTFTYTLNGGPPSTITSGQADTAQLAVPTNNTGIFIYELLSVSDASSTNCSQEQPGTAEVIVISVPQGTITGSTAVCQEDPSPEITFTGSSGTAPYTFTYTVNEGPEQTITTNSGNSVNLAVPTSGPGTYTYELISVQDAGTVSCSNPESGVAIIQVDELPVADAGTGADVCGIAYDLSASASIGTGTWTMTDGTGTATFLPGANDPNARVEVSEYGSKEFTWTVVNGLCSDAATVQVSFYNQPQADAGDGGEECDLDFILNALPASGTGTWSLLSGPGQADFSPSAGNPDATVTVDTFGLYEFMWTEQNQLCQSSDIIEVQFRSLPAIFAGNDTLMCENSSLQLEAEGQGTFAWQPSLSLDDTTAYNPVASPETTTTYTVKLTDQYGCVNYDDVKVEVLGQVMADAGPDQTLEYEFETELNAQLGERETGTWELIRGSGNIEDAAAPQTGITGLSIGENVLLWTVTNGVCPESSDYLRIYVNELVIPSLITPNMDGRNDYFVLQGIQNLGQTELVVFDRSGVKVYENADYDNSWDGSDLKGNPLPEDTYFYVIKSTQGNSRSGYIVIRR